MRKARVVVVALCMVGFMATAGNSLAEDDQSLSGKPLPASLDQLYPPNSPAPVLLLAMHEINQTLSGMVCDLFENDAGNAEANLARFREAYLKTAKLVPEWESLYPIAPVDELETALKSGNPGAVMPVIDKLDAACHSCHVAFTAAVQHKYHWDSFWSLSVSDPESKAQLGFKQFKLMMNTDMVGIGNDLAQGQIENARQHAEAFAGKFAAFKELCTACHDTERTYYVSGDIEGMIGSVKAALEEATPDPAKIGQLLQGIGQESCFKCHLVHSPSALSRN